MNKVDLVDAIAKKAGTTKKTAEAMVDAFTTTVTKSVAKGEKVTLIGFGSFSTLMRSARTGRNPRTGKSIQIPAKKVPRFAPGKAFKDAMKK
jgi:DNA-binding protein HU-beta